MSWQGNECFVAGIEYEHDDEYAQMLDAMSALLGMYGEKGNGWYLLGNFHPDGSAEEDYDPFEPVSYDGDAPSCFCWMPNPFMEPAVLAIRVRNPRDLMSAAFECWDSGLDAIAYAGDGAEPFERMAVYGEVYDMRAA